MRTFLSNKKGMMLIWFYLLFVLLIVTSGSLYGLSLHESQMIAIEQARNKAFYLAEAGLDQKLKELRMGNTANIPNTNYGTGNGSYRVTYCSPTTTSCANPLLSQICSTGTYDGQNECDDQNECDNQDDQIECDGQNKTVRVVVNRLAGPNVPAAISAASNVLVTGNITIDGRDYDATGTNIVGPGTYGVSTGGTLDLQSNATEIGGMGFAPNNPPEEGSYLEGATGNQYASPEEVFGLQPGDLDQYKTATPPPTPFNGIYYLTESWTTNVNFGDADNPSSGVLIIHNNTPDGARLKNVSGYFKGIIIADVVSHINSGAQILGAIVVQNQSGNTIGNGNADIKYSSTILQNLPTSNYRIESWEDEQNS